MAPTLNESNARNFSTMPCGYRIRESDWRTRYATYHGPHHDCRSRVLLWLVNRFIPMQGQIKSILNGLVVIVLVLWIANLYGLFQHLNQFRVGR